MSKPFVSAVVGEDISHSFSPFIFKFLARKLKKNILYGTVDISPNDLKYLPRMLQSLDFIGCNVTIPYKQKVMKYLDQIDKTARSVGAVNVIHREKKKLIGYNTWDPLESTCRHASLSIL